MPNHITNRLTFSGDPDVIATLRKSIRNERSVIDFEKIVSMPEELENIQTGFIRIDGKEYRLYRVYRKGTREVVDEEIFNNNDVDIVGLTDDEVQALIDLYGATNWYDWNISNWGTKWNAYDVKRHASGAITFDTAWSTPLRAMAALSEKFPTVTIKVEYADEDTGNNVGYYILLNGEMVESVDYSDSIEGYGLAMRLRKGKKCKTPKDIILAIAEYYEDIDYAKEIAERYAVDITGIKWPTALPNQNN